jgi:hypothetical protein
MEDIIRKIKVLDLLLLMRKHYLIIVLSLAVGILSSVPQILSAEKVDNFQGIYKAINNDEIYYLARAREIIDGRYNIANPYLFEHKNSLQMELWLPDYLLAKPLALFKINNIQKGYIFYDFLLTFILSVVTYAILYKLTKSTLMSFLVAAFLHLNLFFNTFNRSPAPQLDFIFWLLLFLVLLNFIEKRSFGLAIYSGILSGILFYIYPYYWTFFVVFIILFFVGNFFVKEKINYKKFLLIFSIAFFISIPYFFYSLRASTSPYYLETLKRVNLVETHFPASGRVIVWGSIILLVYLVGLRKKFFKSGDGIPSFLMIGVLASIVVSNHNIITGKNFQFSSHYWMPFLFIFIFSLAYLFGALVEKFDSRRIKIILLLFFSLYVFYHPFLFVVNVVEGRAFVYDEIEKKRQDYAPIFNWLNGNTKKDNVVFANTELSSLIPIYTSNNVYSSSMAGLHFMSNQELQERFILNNYWDQMNEQYAIDHKFGIWGSYHQTVHDINRTKNKLRRVFGMEQKEYVKIPGKDINNFLDFSKDIKNNNFEVQLKKYKVDYFIWDKEADKNWSVEKLNFLKLIVEINGLRIYKVL